MTKSFHMGLSVRGALRNLCLNPKTSILGSASDSKTGRKLSKGEIFDELCDHLAAGHKVIPFSGHCEGFSYETGCPGHEVSDDQVS